MGKVQRLAVRRTPKWVEVGSNHIVVDDIVWPRRKLREYYWERVVRNNKRQEEAKGKVFVYATANSISGQNNRAELPPELVRRFNEVFFVDLPNDRERSEIATIKLKQYNRKPKNFNIDELVKASNGLTGHEIERAIEHSINEYASLQLEKGNVIKGDIDTSCVVKSLNEITPIAKIKSDDIEQMKQWAAKHAKPASTPDESQKLVSSVKSINSLI